jgi:hypothetical protein
MSEAILGALECRVTSQQASTVACSLRYEIMGSSVVEACRLKGSFLDRKPSWNVGE